ncbi:hypothetical protein PVAG01_03321 [Phlyctema vagabunda]|uniref:Uncharacterized protein n=1 Tax=Phlyctema vagabunda TaxID=108571 RepID=A0ABR4PL66_9HELO
MSSASRPQLTLAQKYSHPRGKRHRILKHTHKSGMSPISPTPPQTAADRIRKEKLRIYQKNRFRGFLTSELVDDHESYSYYDKSFLLQGFQKSLHPIYKQDNWCSRNTWYAHLPIHPIYGWRNADAPYSDEGYGENGFWEIDNPFVLNLLGQSLQLASYLLESYDSLAWYHSRSLKFYMTLSDLTRYHSLIFGPKTYIERERLGLSDHDYTMFNKRYFSFGSDIEVKTPDEIELTRRTLLDYGEDIKLGLASGYVDNKRNNGLPVRSKDDAPMGYQGADTFYPPFDKDPVILLAIEKIYPLINPNLTDSELLNTQLAIANELLRATAHTIGRLVHFDEVDETMVSLWVEPYHGSEQANDLGYSWEKTVWGGALAPIFDVDDNANGPGLPVMGFACEDVFTSFHFKRHPPRQNTRILESSEIPEGQNDPYTEHKFFPVPASWCHKFFRDSWWREHKYTPDCTKMPRDVGSIEDLTNHDEPEDKFDRDISIERRFAWKYTDEHHELRELTRRTKTATLLENFGVDLTIGGLPSDSGASSISEYVDGNAMMGDPNCPFFDAARVWFIENRHPERMTIDTMTFAIPESTLHRYMLSISFGVTPAQLRHFLRQCNYDDVLFRTDWTYPHMGMVRRIDKGWNDGPLLPYQIPEGRSSGVDPELADDLEENLSSDAFYTHLGLYMTDDFRDIDSELMRKIVNFFFLSEDFIDAEEWELLVYYFAENNQFWSLGPPGVLRLIGEVEEPSRTPTPEQTDHPDTAFGATLKSDIRSSGASDPSFSRRMNELGRSKAERHGSMRIPVY